MRISVLLLLLSLCIHIPAVPAANPEVVDAITKTALDYMLGWYQVDTKRMKASLHPKLAKRSLTEPSGGKRKLRRTSASDMITYTQHGYGTGLWREGYSINVNILDVYQNIANVKVIAPHYIEYLHMAWIDAQWVIVNTLYEKKKPN